MVGGTRGIGRGIALQLAASGAHVTIAGRSSVKGEETMENMHASRLDSQQEFSSISVDLASIRGCHELVAALKRGVTFDYLVLTVGAWPDLKDPHTPEGVNKVVAVDIIARFALLELLQKSGHLGASAIVLSVLASGKRLSALPMEDIKSIVTSQRNPWLHEFFVVGPIMDSLLVHAATLPTYEGITFLGTCPGLVNTELLSSSGTAPQWLMSVLFALLDVSGVTITDVEAGLRHVSLLNASSVTEGRIRINRVTFLDHEMVARVAHPLTTDNDFRQWLWTYLSSLLGNGSTTEISQNVVNQYK